MNQHIKTKVTQRKSYGKKFLQMSNIYIYLNLCVHNVKIEWMSILNDLVEVISMTYVKHEKNGLPLLAEEVKVQKSYKTYSKRD